MLHSTFASETSAAGESIGMAKYYRAYYCDIMLGAAHWLDVDEIGEEHMQIVLFTDCKSLYDNLKKDGSVPDDKWVAVPVAGLRSALSAGPGRNITKSECRWVPLTLAARRLSNKKGIGCYFSRAYESWNY